MDDTFKFYTDDDSIKMKTDLRKMLGNINSLVMKFMKTYDNNQKLQGEIQNLMYEDQIYKNKKKFQMFNSLLKNAMETVNIEELEDNKKNCLMHQKRSDEMSQVKEFVQGAFLKMLPESQDTNEDEEIKKSKRMEYTVNAHNLSKNSNGHKISEKKIDEKNQAQSGANILFKPNPKFDEPEQDDDDIKIETVPVDLLGKKSKRDKRREKKKNKQENSDPSQVIRSKIVFQSCYICKAKFNKDNIHFFYTNLCVKCGDYNYSFREMKIDLTGRIAVVTGGRVKIGYWIVLKLLRYGCKVISTTRFPKDALVKYMQEPDYESFKDNLIIYPIDFRLFESTEKFVQWLNDNFPHLDILINNAAQTVRRTTSYYKYLLPIESAPMKPEEEEKIIRNDFSTNSGNNMIGGGNGGELVAISSFGNNNQLMKNLESFAMKNNLPLSVVASQVKILDEKEGPKKTMMGQDGQPIDFSDQKSSWNMELDEVPLQEFTEVQIINAWTPYYLCVKLKPLMEKSPFKDRYIINVSSVEGLFNHFKRTSHPHTNMAKAALNMMTRTCGRYYKGYGIYMTSVDTGWVSPMNEFNNLFKDSAKDAFEQEYVNIPLDELDGAMRCIHPVIEGVMNNNFIYGYMLKDYKVTNW
jgi:NAD(P)-dependent dehydrogenase (short-subunit alcohol dehydrogenase family)